MLLVLNWGPILLDLASFVERRPRHGAKDPSWRLLPAAFELLPLAL